MQRKSKIVRPKILIDVTKMRNRYGDVRLNETRDMIVQSGGAAVRKVRNGHTLMAIGGDIKYNTIKNIFEDLHGIDIENFISTPKDWTSKFKPLTEKKRNCCDGKRQNRLVSLAEAIDNKDNRKKDKKSLSRNQVIDRMAKKTLNNRMMEHAIEKALSEKKMNLNNKDTKRFIRINEALISGKKSLYGNTKINEKKVCDYTIDEMEKLVEKLNGFITNINNKMAVLTEGEKIQKLKEQLASYEKCLSILTEEIEYRKVLAEKECKCKNGKCDECDECEKKSLKEGEGDLEFPDLNPNSSDKDDKDDDSDEDSDENNEDSEDEDTELVELSTVVITLADKSAAEDLKTDLLDAGVPEEAIEIAPADEEESDEDEENDEDSEETSAEESDEDIEDVVDDMDANAEDENEQQGESEKKKVSGKKLTEADGDEESDEEATDGNDEDLDDIVDDMGDDSDDSDAEDDSEESEEGEYKLTLVDTDYIDELKDVLMNRWGVTEEEFTDLIGGEIVEDDEDSENDEESDNSEEDKDSKKDKDSEDEDDDDITFDPDEIFKGM